MDDDTSATTWHVDGIKLGKRHAKPKPNWNVSLCICSDQPIRAPPMGVPKRFDNGSEAIG